MEAVMIANKLQAHYFQLTKQLANVREDIFIIVPRKNVNVILREEMPLLCQENASIVQE